MIAWRRVTLGIVLSLMSVQGCDQSGNSTPSPPATPPASNDAISPRPNAVQSEMRLLLEALRDSVTAIANGTVESIPERLEAVDSARRSTERAVESGAYQLPKNAGNIAAFEQLDDRFHAELEALATKARSKDAVSTAAQLGVVLSQCGGCHAQFRP
jgi:hypothetical protein